MNQLFTVVTEGMMALDEEVGLTHRELKALIALMHQRVRDNREVGTNGDFVMSARNVADYARLKSPDVARHAIAGLRRKGVIEVSRHVLKPTTQLTVYRLTERAYEMCFGAKEEGDEKPHDVADETEMTSAAQEGYDSTVIGGMTELSQGGMTEVSYTSINNSLSTPVSQKENAFSRKSGTAGVLKKPKSVPKYPYPTIVDEVADYIMSVKDRPGYDLAELFEEDYDMMRRFIRTNEKKRWMVADKDGSLEPIVDWHHMFWAYALTIANNIDPDMVWSMPPEFSKSSATA